MKTLSADTTPTTLGSAERAESALRDAKELLSKAISKESSAPQEWEIVQPVFGELERALTNVEALREAAGGSQVRSQAKRRDLLSTICHDLKDPLASIVMGASFLRKVIPVEESSASARRVVEAIQRSADKMNQLVLDFYDLAKLESGQLPIESQPIDVVSLVRAAYDAFVPKAKEKGIEVVNVTPADWKATVKCDRARTLVVFSKLLGNALKFTESGAITIGADSNGSMVTFFVRDTGRGIAADRKETIFDRITNASITPRDGTGLGLPLARGLVSLQGGTITVETEPGKGSTFRFTLPIA